MSPCPRQPQRDGLGVILRWPSRDFACLVLARAAKRGVLSPHAFAEPNGSGAEATGCATMLTSDAFWWRS
jgi:hypothetical protein